MNHEDTKGTKNDKNQNLIFEVSQHHCFWVFLVPFVGCEASLWFKTR